MLAFALVLALPAAAQERWQFAPSLALVGEYQDNVNQVPDEGDQEREADVSVLAVPGVGLIYNTYATQAAVRLGTSWRYFFLHPENNNESYLESMALDFEYHRWLTPRVQLDLLTNLAFFFSNSQPGDTAEVLIPRQEALMSGATLGATHKAALHTTLRYEAGMQTAEYEIPESDDSVTYHANVEAQQAVGENYLLVFFAGWRRILFSPQYDLLRALYDEEVDEPARFPWDLAERTDFDVAQVGAGVTYRVTPTVSVTIRSGALVPAHMVEGLYKLSELDWLQRIEFEKAFSQLRINLAYDRDIAPTRGLSDQVLNQSLTATLTGTWVENLTDTFVGGYIRNDAVDGTIDFYRASTHHHYLVLRWLGIAAGYEYTNQLSEFGTRARVTDHRVTLSLSFLPPRPEALRF